MNQQLLREFEAKCVQEEAPACQSSCPIHVDVRGFAQLMAEGKISKARLLLDKVLPLSNITAFLCEGECQKACKRSGIDKSINTPMLERACVLNSNISKPMPYPPNNKKIALLGSGLSSLILAYELGKKGYNIHIFYKEELAQSIKEKAITKLPEKAINETIEILHSFKVEFVKIAEINEDFLSKCLEDNEFLYIGLDDTTISKEALFNSDDYISSPISLMSKKEKILCARAETFIQAIANGKRATGSIERLLQGVDPRMSREKEGSSETKLYTNMQDIAKKVEITPKDALIPTLEEAAEEAKRCIQCACLECVKQCSFLAKYKSYPKKYLREVYNNLAVVQGFRHANTMINSCTQCGLCEKICPNGLNFGDFLQDAREEMLKTKRMPPSAHEFALEDMAFSCSHEVQFIHMEEKKKEEDKKYMFFSGCQLPASLPNEVIACYEHLKKHVKNPVGFHFSCCGMPAQWAGNIEFLNYNLEEFKKKWLEFDKPIYIFACSSCAEFFKKNCPEIEQISLWEILATLPQAENTISLKDEIMPLHDPCSSRNFAPSQEAVRSLLANIKQEYTDFNFTKEMTRCCGFGGLSSSVSPEIADTFLYTRKEELEELQKAKSKKQEILLVYCAICRERFQKIGQKSLHLLELLFPEPNKSTEHCLKESAQKGFLKIYERQEKRLQFKEEILSISFGEKMIKNDIEISLNISHEVEKVLDERHILKSDIIKILTTSQEEVSRFQNNENGHCLAAYRPRQVTYWLEYAKEIDGSYTIFDAYSHRMAVQGIEGKNAQPNYKICCTTNG